MWGKTGQSSCTFSEVVRSVNTHWCCFPTGGASCTMTCGKPQVNLEKSLLEFVAASAEVWWVREGAQWCADRHCRGIWNPFPWEWCGFSLKMLCRSLPGQNWSHEHSPCAPENNLLCHEKKITERALGIFSFTVLIQTSFEIFLLISSWLWSGYRRKKDLIVKAAGGDLV